MNLSKVRQLRQFKIDYTRVRNLEYIDKNKMLPQSFAQFRQLFAPSSMQVQEQARPAFSPDLHYLQTYAPVHFPKGKMLVLVNHDLAPSIKSSLDQYVQAVAYEGYFATVYRLNGGTCQELRQFIRGKLPISGVLMVGSLPTAWVRNGR